MKQTMMFLLALGFVSSALANVTPTGLNKGSAQLNALTNSFKANSNHGTRTLSKDDITMGYGGIDISQRGILVAPVVTA